MKHITVLLLVLLAGGIFYYSKDRFTSAAATAGPQKTFTLTITNSGVGKSTAPKPGTSTYPAGSQVTIAAIPQKLSYFTGWSGDCGGKQATCSIVMNGDKKVNASFDTKSLITNSKDDLILQTIHDPNLTGDQKDARIKDVQHSTFFWRKEF